MALVVNFGPNSRIPIEKLKLGTLYASYPL
jgi:hypothetical protein